MKTFTVIVGIPAYNEAANIAFLLEDVLKQRCESFVLRKVMVLSDGSSDETVAIARRYESFGVHVFDDGKRKGKSERLNEVLEMSLDADAVLLFDADTVLSSDSVFEILVRHIRNGADLVSPELRALSPRTLFGTALVAGHELKQALFSEWNGGDNIYQCHGAARALSRRLVEKLRFKESIGEDAYSYLFAKKFGFRYVSTCDAAIGIRVPESFGDHKKQSQRFLFSQTLFRNEFGTEKVSAEYRCPRLLLMKHCVLSFARHPLAFSEYLVITIFTWFFLPKSNQKQAWAIASSSKTVR